jgi:AcrR family transcriptional regulator
MPSKPATTPRKLPKQERSRITVEAILQATTHILTEEGYDKANTNRVCETSLNLKSQVTLNEIALSSQ